MNYSRLIEVRSDLHAADLEVKECMKVSMEFAHKANFATANVDEVIKTWGKDSDMVDIANSKMHIANEELVVANRETASAIARMSALADELAAMHQPETV